MKHLELKDFSSDNYRYYVEKPDKDFSPKRNYSVINKIIKQAYKQRTEIDPVVKQNAGNVADILSSFAKYKLDLDGGKKIEEWLGKEWMTKIYGEKLIEKLKVRDSIRKLNQAKGNTMLNGDFYIN
jgi:hypothetical protein